MEAWHQKNIMNTEFPLNVIITDMVAFPPHWHEAIEVIYACDGPFEVGINNEIIKLYPQDILLVGSGEAHYFLPQQKQNMRIIIQFELSLFESFSATLRERRFIDPLIRFLRDESEGSMNSEIHKDIETQILRIKEEFDEKLEGYKLAIKARMFDLFIILLRQVPTEAYPQREMNRHLKMLERLEQVLVYVEDNYDKEMTLEAAAKISNFSVYHFTRFFKDAMGMTFIQYLNNYRISKATSFLLEQDDSITEISFRVGFCSIKTFNRVFKKIKGCSPSEFKKAIYEYKEAIRDEII